MHPLIFSYLRFPKPVEIAIGVDRDGILTVKGEAHDGLFTGDEKLAMVAAVGDKSDPAYGVISCHWMAFFAYVDGYFVPYPIYKGCVLLLSRVGIFGLEVIHRRAAAIYYRARGVDHSYKIAAAAADEKVAFLVHILPPFHRLLLDGGAPFIHGENISLTACIS